MPYYRCFESSHLLGNTVFNVAFIMYVCDLGRMLINRCLTLLRLLQKPRSTISALETLEGHQFASHYCLLYLYNDKIDKTSLFPGFTAMSSSEWDHLVAMNGQCPPSVEALYQDHFAQQVEARPAAISIFSPSHSITYAELDALSNALANFLVSQGIGPEVVVPLCFEHSPWAIISMLSVVKAGGVFTFLDAASPRSRLQDIVNNIDAKALLISPSLAESSCVAGIFPTSFVISDEFIRNLPAANAPSTTTLDHSNLLYLIFTSGSTGLPKGVCISHSAYLSSALHQRTVCRLGPESRVLQFAKYTFDISILETLTTLISGGCICIPDEDARGRGLEHVMNEFRITWSVMTVSLSRVIEPVEVPSLRTLLLGGEPLTPTDLTRWAGHVQLMNVSITWLSNPARRQAT